MFKLRVSVQLLIICISTLKPTSMMIMQTPTTVALFTVFNEFSAIYTSALHIRIALANDMNKKVVHCEIIRNLATKENIAYQRKVGGSSHEVATV